MYAYGRRTRIQGARGRLRLESPPAPCAKDGHTHGKPRETHMQKGRPGTRPGRPFLFTRCTHHPWLCCYVKRTPISGISTWTYAQDEGERFARYTTYSLRVGPGISRSHTISSPHRPRSFVQCRLVRSLSVNGNSCSGCIDVRERTTPFAVRFSTNLDPVADRPPVDQKLETRMNGPLRTVTQLDEGTFRHDSHDRMMSLSHIVFLPSCPFIRSSEQDAIYDPQRQSSTTISL